MRFDDAFANGKYIPGGAEFPALWARKAEGFRSALGQRARLGQAMSADNASWYDLFLPEAEPQGLIVFAHGGYWMAFGPRDFSHLAAGAVARGWACAMPAYTLAPKARISAITGEVAAVVASVAEAVPGPIIVTGHSAGGHLSARMAAPDIAARLGAAAGRLRRVVPISPLSDLRPLMETSMNETLGLDLAEARAESPALAPRRTDVGAHVWVGGAERPAFLDQARRLGNAWACPVTVDEGKHHFDVIEGLEAAESPLMSALLG
ncbi:MAG: alpha/beta hydrolase [Rhodobacteraceae bacterium]|nr:alpha/beta hydrolase [Paracoccaceae bacterium]